MDAFSCAVASRSPCLWAIHLECHFGDEAENKDLPSELIIDTVRTYSNKILKDLRRQVSQYPKNEQKRTEF